MSGSTVAEDFIIPTYKRWPVEFVEGHGATLVDSAGRSYVDMVGGIAVATVGHSHPAVVSAVTDQVGRLTHVSNFYRTRPQTALAARLADLTDGMLSFFGNSGAEAIECALKISRKRGRESSTDKTLVVAAEGSFHGRTFGALSATGQPAKRAPFEPLVPGFVHVPFGDADALSNAMSDEVAAVLLEPIQGEAGVVVPPDGYLQAARELCDRWGAVLILDEIQTGLARTGKWFGWHHWDAAPDVMCLAKALGGGLPIGACLASPEVARSLSVGDHASTFGGGPVQCAAGLAVIDVIESEGLVERAADVGEVIQERLRSIAPRDVEVRGRGLLLAVDLPRPVARAIARSALDAGVLVNDATDSVVRLAPPLVIRDDELDRAMEVLEKVFATEEAT